jgi:hypothetical protein
MGNIDDKVLAALLSRIASIKSELEVLENELKSLDGKAAESPAEPIHIEPIDISIDDIDIAGIGAAVAQEPAEEAPAAEQATEVTAAEPEVKVALEPEPETEPQTAAEPEVEPIEIARTEAEAAEPVEITEAAQEEAPEEASEEEEEEASAEKAPEEAAEEEEEEEEEEAEEEAAEEEAEPIAMADPMPWVKEEDRDPDLILIEDNPDTGEDMPEGTEAPAELETEQPAEAEAPADDLPFFDQTPEPEPAPTPSEKKKEKVKKILVDTMTAETAVMDVMAEKQAWRTDRPGTPVKNIISAISLNDRVLLINVLFKEDPILFQETIARFNGMASFDEAVAYVGEQFPDWDLNSETVYRLMMAIRRKLN